MPGINAVTPAVNTIVVDAVEGGVRYEPKARPKKGEGFSGQFANRCGSWNCFHVHFMPSFF